MVDEASMASRQARLQRLKTKMNQSLSANRQDIVEEQVAQRERSQKRSVGQARKLAKAERLLDERDLREAGKDVERHRAMNYSIEENEAWEAKLEDKEVSRDKGAIAWKDTLEHVSLLEREHSLCITYDNPRVMIDVAAAAEHVLGKEVDALYSPQQMHASNGKQLQERHRDLVLCLVRILRPAYHKHLLCDATTYPVMVVHNPIWVECVQDALCGVLLGNLRVPSVCFVDSHTLALLSVGRYTGLVVDCGYWETVVLPVYAGRPLHSCLTTTPRAGRRLESVVKALVQTISAQVSTAVIQRITTEAVYVNGRIPMNDSHFPDPMDLDQIRNIYSDTDAQSITIETEDAPITIPGWMRTAACEVLFDQGNEDEVGVLECARQSVAKLPLDTRKEILDAVLLMGGTSMLPNFASRFEAQWNTSYTNKPSDSLKAGASPICVLNVADVENVRMPPIPADVLAWTGGSIAATIGLSGTERVSRADWRSN
ncbi:hypothetical protein MYAM1_003779 [Malassezia yamatoensis]|uniref:Uncharacterized protein n=1 Tax=Malassezia yamatoensis TaxID=253288 RepID=A0AAJ5YXE8_9BASI|nr:hypothetical protein MYAM1_003779 [Malassezia yamatoensis]